jgi:nitroreductase
MPIFIKPVIEIIPERFSCRSYQDTPVSPASINNLRDFISTNSVGPFGSQPRFKLEAAGLGETESLRGLGTYGFINGATAYLIGASQPQGYYLEDFGYLMEQHILAATALGLGTCWLGGSFTRSSFGKRIQIQPGEEIPAVAALGIMADPEKARDGFIRKQAGSHERRKWEKIFSDNEFGKPLSKASAGKYALPLEMVRLGPSASNKQPWQIVRSGSDWHFYLRRTAGYRDGRINKVLNISDLQRVDIGIAMCHFELTAQELDLTGRWLVKQVDIDIPNEGIEYVVTWCEEE